MVLFQWVLGCCWCSLSRVLEEGRQLKRMAPRFVVVTSSHLQAWALLDGLGPFQGWDLSELSRLGHFMADFKQKRTMWQCYCIHVDPPPYQLKWSEAFTLSKDGSRRGFSWFIRWLCNRSAPVFRWSSSRGCLWRSHSSWRDSVSFWTRAVCVALKRSKTDAMDCTLDRLRQALLVLNIGLWPFLHSFSRWLGCHCCLHSSWAIHFLKMQCKLCWAWVAVKLQPLCLQRWRVLAANGTEMHGLQHS